MRNKSRLWKKSAFDKSCSKGSLQDSEHSIHWQAIPLVKTSAALLEMTPRSNKTEERFFT
jgi:hypothetical protein